MAAEDHQSYLQEGQTIQNQTKNLEKKFNTLKISEKKELKKKLKIVKKREVDEMSLQDRICEYQQSITKVQQACFLLEVNFFDVCKIKSELVSFLSGVNDKNDKKSAELKFLVEKKSELELQFNKTEEKIIEKKNALKNTKEKVESVCRIIGNTSIKIEINNERILKESNNIEIKKRKIEEAIKKLESLDKDIAIFQNKTRKLALQKILDSYRLMKFFDLFILGVEVMKDTKELKKVHNKRVLEYRLEYEQNIENRIKEYENLIKDRFVNAPKPAKKSLKKKSVNKENKEEKEAKVLGEIKEVKEITEIKEKIEAAKKEEEKMENKQTVLTGTYSDVNRYKRSCRDSFEAQYFH